MRSLGRLVFLYACFVTWVLGAVVEGCGRTELDISLTGDGEAILTDSSLLPDGALRDGTSGDAPRADARPAEGGVVDGTVGDAVRDGPPITDAITPDGMNCSPLVICNGACANTNTDPRNCGSCGT